MSEFKRGDKVRITIDAEIVRADNVWVLVTYHVGGAEPDVDDTEFAQIAHVADAVTVKHLPSTAAPVPTLPAPDRDVSINAFSFSVRIYNGLRRNGIHTVGALLDRTEDDLMDIKGFGSGALYEVKDTLAAHGLELPS